MDLGMSELLVIGIVALIVIGPKDLPEMFRQLGRFTAKMRGMAREFSRAMEQAANETGVRDVARDLKAATDPKSMGLNAVKDAVDKFERWDPIKNAAKPTAVMQPGASLTPPPMPATPAPVAAAAQAAETVAETGAETVAKTGAVEKTSGLGPNTAALYEKKAAKEAIVQEAASKLKALESPAPAKSAAPSATAKAAPKSAATADKPVPKSAPKSAPKTPRKASAKTETPAPKAAAPKAPRKKKVAEE